MLTSVKKKVPHIHVVYIDFIPRSLFFTGKDSELSYNTYSEIKGQSQNMHSGCCFPFIKVCMGNF